MNEWLAGAERACNEAVSDPTQADRLLRLAQVRALIAIARSIEGIRELIVMTETEAPEPDYDDREEC